MRFSGIMKVQLPLQVLGADPTPVGMAYDEGRRFLLPFDPALVAGRMGEHFPETHKAFFHCTIDDNDRLTIGAKAPWQDW